MRLILILVLSIITTTAHAGLVATAQKYEGLHERANYSRVKAIVGHNPKRIPWCGTFACHVLKKNGYKCPPSKASARSYLELGKKVSLSQARRGDLVVYARRSGGHVGFFVKSTGRGKIEMVSGNDGNAVKTRVRSTKGVIGVRRVVGYKNRGS